METQNTLETQKNKGKSVAETKKQGKHKKRKHPKKTQKKQWKHTNQGMSRASWPSQQMSFGREVKWEAGGLLKHVVF